MSTNCGLEGCIDPRCPVCRWLRVPLQPLRCPRAIDGLQCRLIARHPGPCRSPKGRTLRPHQPVNGTLPF